MFVLVLDDWCWRRI